MTGEHMRIVPGAGLDPGPFQAAEQLLQAWVGADGAIPRGLQIAWAQALTMRATLDAFGAWEAMLAGVPRPSDEDVQTGAAADVLSDALWLVQSYLPRAIQ